MGGCLLGLGIYAHLKVVKSNGEDRDQAKFRASAKKTPLETIRCIPFWIRIFTDGFLP